MIAHYAMSGNGLGRRMKWLGEGLYKRCQAIPGREENNGIALWRQLHVSFSGNSEIVELANVQSI